MSIEKDINQKNFRNEHQKSMINLIYTYNWINARNRMIFDRCNITPQQFNILRILRGAGIPLSTLQIRLRMLDNMSDTSRIVDRLILKQLVQKLPSETDKRLVDITITDKGRALLAELDLYQEEMDGIVKNLSEEEARLLNTLLDKIRMQV